MNVPEFKIIWHNDLRSFVYHWCQFYNYPLEHLYSDRIRQQFLEQARLVTEERGLHQWNAQIIEEQKTLRNEVEKWARLIDQNAPLKVRIEQARITEYISEAMRLMDKT